VVIENSQTANHGIFADYMKMSRRTNGVQGEFHFSGKYDGICCIGPYLPVRRVMALCLKAGQITGKVDRGVGEGE